MYATTAHHLVTLIVGWEVEQIKGLPRSLIATSPGRTRHTGRTGVAIGLGNWAEIRIEAGFRPRRYASVPGAQYGPGHVVRVGREVHAGPAAHGGAVHQGAGAHGVRPVGERVRRRATMSLFRSFLLILLTVACAVWNSVIRTCKKTFYTCSVVSLFTSFQALLVVFGIEFVSTSNLYFFVVYSYY